MNIMTSNAKMYKSRDSRYTLALPAKTRVLLDVVTVVVVPTVLFIVDAVDVFVVPRVPVVVAAAAVVFIVAAVDVCVVPRVVVVVADPRNKDGSTLCVQLYEIDVAKPTWLFPISKIE